MLIDALLHHEVEGRVDRLVEEVEELESKRAEMLDELAIKVAEEVDEQLQDLLPTIFSQIGDHVSNQGNIESQNDNAADENIHEDNRNANIGNGMNRCSYKDFVACKPKESDGKGGGIAYNRWITILKTNTPYSSRKIRRIRACTHQRPQRNEDQYAVSRRSQYTVLKIQYVNILEDIKRDPYSKKLQYAFEKIKDVKVEDVSLICDIPLDVFNKEVSRLSGMDNDLFTYEVKVTNIPCNSKIDDDSEHEADDDMGYDPSKVAFIEWLASKLFNYKTMDHYTMKALWIYWIREDDEVELTDKESLNDEDEITEVFRTKTNIFNYETPLCSTFNDFNYLLKVDLNLLTKDIMGFKTYEDYKDGWIYEWNKDVPWVYDKPWIDNGIWKEPTPVKHMCKPWLDNSLRDDGYCNGGNLP
ncbi:hypothetical protein Tco_0615088 [Tanacetum coccineum]